MIAKLPTQALVCNSPKSCCRTYYFAMQSIRLGLGPHAQFSHTALVTCLGYDSRGNQVLSIDPKANSAITVFDGASRAIQTQQHLRQAGQGQNPPVDNQTLLPGGSAYVVTTMVLDGNGRQTQLVDDRGGTTLFAYDTMDREVTMTFHDGSTRTSVYDEADNVVLYTDENGNQFTNAFDALGRKVSVDIAVAAGVSPTTQSQSFRYDGLSRMTCALNSDEPLTSQPAGINSTVTLVYDSLGRVVEEAAGLRQQYPLRDQHGLYFLPRDAVPVSGHHRGPGPHDRQRLRPALSPHADAGRQRQHRLLELLRPLAAGQGAVGQRPDLHLAEQRANQ